MNLLFIFIFLLRHSFQTLSLSSEGHALLSLKTTFLTDQTNSVVFSNWNPFDLDPCRWTGITCTVLTKNSPPTVISISLPGRNLTGQIPPQLGLLPNLRRISLRGNRFVGPIPDELFNASSLRSIFIHNNKLSGPLPPSLCNIQRLQNADFSNNELSGTIPGDLINCKNLQRLVLAGNGFTGEIPAGIWTVMENLEEVDLSRNSLSGLIPDDFGDSIKSLLNLSYNHFTGNIPESLRKLPGMVKFDLSNNNLTGEIPLYGAFENQGPAAFLNNPMLCGFPLEKSCDDMSSSDKNGSRRKGLKASDIALISAAHFVLVACIGIVAVYVCWKRRKASSKCGCPWKRMSTEKEEQPSLGSFCTCFRPNAEASDMDSVAEYSGEGGVGELVCIDKEFGFEIDELLRASAYMLGMGVRGIVYKVVLGNGVPMVVRRLGRGKGHGSQEFGVEAQAIGRVKHPNVVRLRAHYWTEEEKLLVSDFIPNGNLATALHGRNGQPSRSLTWSVRLNIAKGVAAGLASIHECSARKEVHGDIRPTNILLDNEFNPFISDFGLDRLITITGSSSNSANNNLSSCGILGPAIPCQHLVPTDKSNSYSAPESRNINNKPTQKWDVYSFGVVLLQLLTGRNSELAQQTPSNAFDDLGLVKWVRKGLRLRRKNQAEESVLSSVIDRTLIHDVRAQKAAMALLQLALDCTEDDPETRPKMKLVSESLDRIET